MKTNYQERCFQLSTSFFSSYPVIKVFGVFNIETYLQDLVNNQEQCYHLYYFESIQVPTNQQLDKGCVKNLMRNVLQRLTYFTSWFLVGCAVLGVYDLWEVDSWWRNYWRLGLRFISLFYSQFALLTSCVMIFDAFDNTIDSHSCYLKTKINSFSCTLLLIRKSI